MLRALLFAVCTVMPVQAQTIDAVPGHPVEGLWGFALADDMTCAVNPVRIDLSADGRQLIFTWPKTVHYSDGTANDGVTFTVIGLDGLRLELRRDKDDVGALIAVATDGKSFQYEEDGPNEGSRFDRCDELSS